MCKTDLNFPVCDPCTPENCCMAIPEKTRTLYGIGSVPAPEPLDFLSPLPNFDAGRCQENPANTLQLTFEGIINYADINPTPGHVNVVKFGSHEIRFKDESPPEWLKPGNKIRAVYNALQAKGAAQIELLQQLSTPGK
jgi:hypothetical protein